MKRNLLSAALVALMATSTLMAQDLKSKDVPSVVKSALIKKYPSATKVSWEKEKTNFEANWGGKSGEDNSVLFSPSGSFMEIVVAIPVTALPKPVVPYVAKNYKGSKINEAGKVTDAAGKLTYETELKGKVLIFDEKGNFLKIE